MRRRGRQGRVNTGILFGGLAAMMAVVALLAISIGREPTALEDKLVGRKAPRFVLQDLDGNEVDLGTLAGRPVVLNFWSTWCIPCKQEHPVLVEAARMYPSVAFYGVVYQDTAPKTKAYLKQHGTSYPHLLDPGSRMAIDYGVAGVPETYFIDRTGTVVQKASFAVSRTYLYQTLEQLLADPT